MNVTVNRAEFLAAAKRAASVAPLSSPLEPLRGILLETDRREGCLTISATNLEVSLVQTIPCTSLDADALVLNARLLEGMLDKLEGDSVTLIRMEQQPVVLLTSGLAAYRIGVWERGIFPQIESPYPADTVLVTGIPAMTKRTIFAVGEKKNTPLLRCVNLMFTPNGLKAVGSNGSCVVSAKGDSQSTGNISLLVPASSLGKLAHMCEDIVSQETFDEAQRQLETLRRHSSKRETNTPVVHLFSRKLKCGHCGLALGRHVVDLGVYYHCERRAWNSGAACLGARLFEDDLIRTVLASIRFQARLAGKAEKRLDKLENAERRERESLWEQRRRIQMKLDHLTTQKAEAFLLFNQGDLTQKTYDAKCAKLDKTILEQRTKLLDMSGTQTGTQDGAVLHCREDIARLKELSHLRTLNRQTVEKLIQSIRVYDGKRIEIVWNFSDSYMKLLTGEEQNHEG